MSSCVDSMHAFSAYPNHRLREILDFQRNFQRAAPHIPPKCRSSAILWLQTPDSRSWYAELWLEHSKKMPINFSKLSWLFWTYPNVSGNEESQSIQNENNFHVYSLWMKDKIFCWKANAFKGVKSKKLKFNVKILMYNRMIFAIVIEMFFFFSFFLISQCQTVSMETTVGDRENVCTM